MKEDNKKPNTIIIGAGPAGSSAALYLKRFNYPVLLIDAGAEVHGRTSMATDMSNFIGHDKEGVTGEDLLKRIVAQLKRHQINLIKKKVVRVSKKDKYHVETDDGHEYIGDFLIIAVGLSDNMPEIEGLGPYFDHSIYHCLMCDWYQNRDKKIAVIGNSDSSVMMARIINYMHKPPKLSVIPSKSKVSFSKKLIDKVKKDDVEVFQSKIKCLGGDNGYLQHIILEDGSKVEAEVIFTNLGYKRFDEFLDKGGLNPKRNSNGFIIVNKNNFESSIENLYAVGPCNDGQDQAIIAGGEGALAASSIHSKVISKEFQDD